MRADLLLMTLNALKTYKSIGSPLDTSSETGYTPKILSKNNRGFLLYDLERLTFCLYKSTKQRSIGVVVGDLTMRSAIYQCCNYHCIQAPKQFSLKPSLYINI